MAAYDQAVQSFVSLIATESGASSEVDALAQSHAVLQSSNTSFWLEADKWTNGRREEAFKIL